MIRRDLDKISESDLNLLIRDSRTEDKRLEFKGKLDLDGEHKQNHKHHLIQEVVGFANEDGGDLVVGVADNNDGEAEKLIGMNLSSVDDTKERWGSILRDNIEPSIPSNLLDMEAIEFQNVNGDDRHGIIIRTEASWRAPHRETLTHRFYGRSPSGKQELDMGEIRDRFVKTERFTERVKGFRDGRIYEILARLPPTSDRAPPFSELSTDQRFFDGSDRSYSQLPMPLVKEEPLFVLHLIPANAFTRGAVLDPRAADNSKDGDEVYPQLLSNYPRGRYTRYNTDGYLMASTIDREGEKVARRYVQTFRSGPIESVTDYGFMPQELDSSRFDYSYIFTEDLREQLIVRLSEYVEFLNEQDAQYPYTIFLTAISAAGFYVAPEGQSAGYPEYKYIDTNDARFTEVMVESPSTEVNDVVSDLMDYLYQAAGHEGEPASQKKSEDSE